LGENDEDAATTSRTNHQFEGKEEGEGEGEGEGSKNAPASSDEHRFGP